MVVSLDGGRVRVRRKKRGPKTKKGRNRFHTDWKEPKLLILYVVGDDGRPSQTWAPIIDGTLRGPEAVFALLLSYARQIGLNAADKVLFIADGAPWIWQRIQRLIAALGLSPTQVLGLIDFYHAAKQLSDAVKLRRWSATQRTRWLNRTRGLLCSTSCARRGERSGIRSGWRRMWSAAGRWWSEQRQRSTCCGARAWGNCAVAPSQASSLTLGGRLTRWSGVFCVARRFLTRRRSFPFSRNTRVGFPKARRARRSNSGFLSPLLIGSLVA